MQTQYHVLFSLSFYLLGWVSVTLNSLYGICAWPGNMATYVASGNKRNYLIFKVSYIGQSACQYILTVPSHHGDIRLLLAVVKWKIQLKLLLKQKEV